MALPNSRLPHVLHVIDSLALGGAERMAVEIANATNPKRFRVSLCVTRSGLHLADRLSSDVKVLALERTSRFDLGGARRFVDYCKRENVGLAHVHGRSSTTFFAAAKVFSRVISRIPLVVHDHYGDVEIAPEMGAAFRTILRLTKPAYVGVHRGLVAGAREILGPTGNVKLIPNAIDFGQYEAPKPGGSGDPVIVMVSNLRPTKNVLGLLHVLKELTDLPWRVEIVGSFADEGYAAECKAVAARPPLVGRIRFLGPLLETVDILKRATVGVLISKSESGPLVVLEYLAAGLPIVATTTGEIARELAALDVPGFVPRHDDEAFGAELRRVLTMELGERKERARRGKDLASSHFDISVVIKTWEKLYDDLMGA